VLAASPNGGMQNMCPEEPIGMKKNEFNK